MYTVIGFILASLIFVGLVLYLRRISGRENPTFSVFIPAQMHALVVTKSMPLSTSGAERDKTQGQGNVVDVVHSIPGKRLVKSGSDHMNWHYELGEEPRGLLYRLFGIQIIWFFRYLRLNDVRTFRWGRKDSEIEYSMQAKSQLTRHVFFSGQHDMDFKGVETGAMLKLNLRFNVVYEEKFPVRVRLRTADPYAVLTMRVNGLVIRILGGEKDPKKLIENKDLQESLANEIRTGVSKDAEDQFGIEIKFVTLTEIDFDAETKRLLELETTTDIENKAKLAIAQNDAKQEIERARGNREARIIRNEGDAHRVETVIKPGAATDLMVRVREAEAYENNETVTVFAPGAKTMIPLSSTE